MTGRRGRASRSSLIGTFLDITGDDSILMARRVLAWPRYLRGTYVLNWRNYGVTWRWCGRWM